MLPKILVLALVIFIIYLIFKFRKNRQPKNHSPDFPQVVYDQQSVNLLSASGSTHGVRWQSLSKIEVITDAQRERIWFFYTDTDTPILTFPMHTYGADKLLEALFINPESFDKDLHIQSMGNHEQDKSSLLWLKKR